MDAINVAEYEQQLAVVETALLGVNGDAAQHAELVALRENLLELLQLAQHTAPAKDDGNAADAEMKRFLSEMAQLDEDKETSGDAEQEDVELQLQKLKSQLEEMVGQKCSAPHEHSWGSVAYHNAIVCGVADGVELDGDGSLDMRVRVLFTNPTHREMLPCEYYLGGECRFDDSKCHYSHGELVPMGQLRAYVKPDFELLARNCVVLAKLSDRLWHRGKVLCANFVEKTCRVRLEGKEQKERDQDFAFEELLPIFQDDDEDSDSSEDDDSSGTGETDEAAEQDDFEAARHANLVQQSLFTFQPNQALGEWEKHTRGIASKLMAKMGYVTGTGLGSDGRGIVTPVSAQILPQGRSLDHCMELRDLANGDKDLFSVEKKLRHNQKKQEAANAKAYERAVQRVDVFSFLNNSVLSAGRNSTQAASTSGVAVGGCKPNGLAEHSTKALNVESVRVADDIRRKEREIDKVRESLKRNADNAEMTKRLRAQLSCRMGELQTLQQTEHSLCKEQATRKTKDKMFVF